ncbi:MAG: hypothetical protein ABIJ15_04235 [bacterium]
MLNKISAFMNRKLIYLFYVFIAFTLINLLLYHLKLILYPYPLDPNEGAILLTTEKLIKAENPFLLKNQPAETNVYGVFYNFVSYPFAKVFGNTTQVHKTVAGISILLSCWLIFLWMSRLKIPLALKWASLAILYSSFLFYVTPLTRPDGLGLFLFLASIFIPYFFEFSYVSLFLSVFLGLSAFYTKNYFILGIFYVISYVFLFVSKKRGIIIGSSALFIFLSSAFIMNGVYEWYFYNAFLANYNITSYYDFWAGALLKQVVTFIRVNAGLTVIFAIIIYFIVLKDFKKNALYFRKNLNAISDLSRWEEPFFLKRISLNTYCLILSSLVLFLKMGGWGGMWMCYFFQLLSPFFVVFVIDKLKAVKINYAVILLLIIWNMVSMYSFKGEFKSDDERLKNWEIISKRISNKKDVLHAMAIAPIIINQNKKVYDTGNSWYFVWGGHIKSKLLKFIFKRGDDIIVQNNKYKEFVTQKVKLRKFDLIVLEKGVENWMVPQKIIRDNYTPKETMEMYFPHVNSVDTLVVWEPKKRGRL